MNLNKQACKIAKIRIKKRKHDLISNTLLKPLILTKDG